MISPPRTAEAILEGLSAKSDFRDGILGDLAEEFSERAERDGMDAARRWYYRESFRAAPHLLLDWVLSLRVREVRRLVNVLFTSYFLVTILITLLTFMTRYALQSFGIATDLLVLSPSQAAPTRGFILGALTGVLAGYFTASLDTKTPLASAIAFGVLNSLPAVVWSLAVGTIEQTWYSVAATIVCIVGATVGGILQIQNSRLTNRDADPDSRGNPVAS